MDVEVNVESPSLADLVFKSDIKVSRANVSSEQAQRMEEVFLKNPSFEYFFESEEVAS